MVQRMGRPQVPSSRVPVAPNPVVPEVASGWSPGKAGQDGGFDRMRCRGQSGRIADALSVWFLRYTSKETKKVFVCPRSFAHQMDA